MRPGKEWSLPRPVPPAGGKHTNSRPHRLPARPPPLRYDGPASFMSFPPARAVGCFENETLRRGSPPFSAIWISSSTDCTSSFPLRRACDWHKFHHIWRRPWPFRTSSSGSGRNCWCGVDQGRGHGPNRRPFLHCRFPRNGFSIFASSSLIRFCAAS